MITTYQHDLSKGTGKALVAALNSLLARGYVPLTSCFIGASDGPGAILYTLGQTSDGAAEKVEDGASNGNGSSETLAHAEVIDPQ